MPTRCFRPTVWAALPRLSPTLPRAWPRAIRVLLLVARSARLGPPLHFRRHSGRSIDFPSARLLSTTGRTELPLRSRQSDRGRRTWWRCHHPFPLNDIGVALGLPNRKPRWSCTGMAKLSGQRSLTGLVAPFIRRTLARAQRIIVSHPIAGERVAVSRRPQRKMRGRSLSGSMCPYWTELDSAQRRRVEELRLALSAPGDGHRAAGAVQRLRCAHRSAAPSRRHGYHRR